MVHSECYSSLNDVWCDLGLILIHNQQDMFMLIFKWLHLRIKIFSKPL